MGLFKFDCKLFSKHWVNIHLFLILAILQYSCQYKKTATSEEISNQLISKGFKNRLNYTSLREQFQFLEVPAF